MGDARSGIGAAIAAAGPLAAGAEVEELDLFDGTPHAGSPIDESAKALDAPTVRAAGRKGPGRPGGSRNATTEQILKFLQARYRHPLLGLADVAATSPEQLAVLIAGGRHLVDRETRWRAWQMWATCAKELAEYMVPKQPRTLALASDSAPLIQMFMGSPGQPGPQVSAAFAPIFEALETLAKSEASDPIGGEVLDGAVLQAPISIEKSNG